mmetsp:Transcript_33709/g.43263  ORF Transcript_33709/g.43263 Transcript_33709/m.43263 type:complete len:104 (-) Transcript_33709:62-373(-)
MPLLTAKFIHYIFLFILVVFLLNEFSSAFFFHGIQNSNFDVQKQLQAKHFDGDIKQQNVTKSLVEAEDHEHLTFISHNYQKSLDEIRSLIHQSKSIKNPRRFT